VKGERRELGNTPSGGIAVKEGPKETRCGAPYTVINSV